MEFGDGRLNPLRAQAEAHLSTCPAKTETVNGRPYLSLTGYLAWKERLVKGDLAKHLQTGFVRESFNHWVRGQGDKAELAGIPVDEIEPWMGEFPREAVSLSELGKKLGARRKVLADMNRFLTFPAMVHPRTEQALKHTDTFRRHAREWVGLHRDASGEVQRYAEAERLLSRRYFSGEEVYFPATREELDSLLASLSQMDDLYQEGVAPELTRGHTEEKEDGHPERAAGETTGGGAEGSHEAGRYAGHLIVLARAETLDNLGRKNEGISLVEEWLKENGL